MSIIILMVVIAVVGLIAWAIVTYVPLPDPFKKIVIAVAVIGIILYVCQALGLFALLRGT